MTDTETLLRILRNYNPSSEPPKGTLPATLPFSPDLLRTLGGRKAHLRCSQTVFQDLQALCDLVESEYGRDPLVLSGHRLSTILPINLTILFLSDSLTEGDVPYLESVLYPTDLIVSRFSHSSAHIPDFPEVYVGLEEPSNNPPLRVKPLDLPPSANPSDDDTLLPAHSKVSITTPDGRVLDLIADTEGTTSSELIRKVRDFFATENV